MEVITRIEVLNMLRLGDTTLRRMIENGLFPKPFTITGSRPQLWLRSEIDTYVKACIDIESQLLSANRYINREEMIGRVVGSIEKQRLINDRKELSNEDFVEYFKRLSKEDKIAAFGELFERFTNACEENRKASEVRELCELLAEPFL